MNKINKRDITIDFLRGLVLIIMALDHARDTFLDIDVGGTIIIINDPVLLCFALNNYNVNGANFSHFLN